jgi:hypothetical protein
MISPVVICVGVIRSGSTWAFNVCRVLSQAGANHRKQKFGTACLGAESLDHFLQVEAPMGDGAAVIKAHEMGAGAIEYIALGKVRAVCTFRDPRDCVASDLIFWGKGFDESVSRVMWSMQCVGSLHRQAPKALFVRYEAMMGDPIGQIRRIGQYLGVGLDHKAAEWIHSQTNLETSRNISRQLGSKLPEQVDVGLDNHRRDKLTLLHDNHIGNAQVGRWKKELTVEQGEYLTKVFRENLTELEYEGWGTRAWPSTGDGTNFGVSSGA